MSGTIEIKNNEKFEIKKCDIVSLWEWDIDVEHCAICRNHITELCIECQANQLSSKDCALAWGVCGHAFHFHCINRWLTTRHICPLDTKDWEFQNYQFIN